MHHQHLAPDVWLFVGDAYESAATAFLDGTRVLLVDALGSLEDARRMREQLHGRGLQVAAVASTHYMDDHMAGLGLFADALRIAHAACRRTFLSQATREEAFYLEPTLTFEHQLRLRWGRHELSLFHNPGKTPDHINVDAGGADLVCAGDNIVGNIVYLSRADPADIDAAIERLQRLRRRWVVSAHMGRFPAAALDNARHYLARLRARVIALRSVFAGTELAQRIAWIRIEDCLPEGIAICAFEREWHRNNLDLVRDRSLFTPDACARDTGALSAAWPPTARAPEASPIRSANDDD